MMYNSVFITHNPNIMGPTKKKRKNKQCFGPGFLLLFSSLKTKNLSLSNGNREQKICVFKSWNLSFSGNLVNSVTLWDLFAVNYQISFSPLILPLHLLHFSSFLPPNFQHHFTLFPTSLSPPPFTFCLHFIPNNIWDDEPKHWTCLRWTQQSNIHN